MRALLALVGELRLRFKKAHEQIRLEQRQAREENEAFSSFSSAAWELRAKYNSTSFPQAALVYYLP